MRLENKVAMVVGGGQTPREAIGNGRATALTFAREGARVAVLDRDLSSAQDTVAMIAENGGAATAIACDITDEKTIIDAVAETMSSYGRIDILHNNVGVGSFEMLGRGAHRQHPGTALVLLQRHPEPLDEPGTRQVLEAREVHLDDPAVPQ